MLAYVGTLYLTNDSRATLLAITARQVAELSGVSISTVGRALADDPRITNDTKQRVRRAADRLGYVENSAARILRGGSSKLVGLMLPDIRNDFYASISAALSRCCDAAGYQLALSAADDRESEARHLKQLVSAHVAGIVIVPSASPTRATRDMLQQIPHAQLLRRISSCPSAWFGIEEDECLRVGTTHLLELGHRRIAYLGGSAELSTGAARLRGFRRAFAEAAISNAEVIEELGPPTLAFGNQALARILAHKPRPTALITASVQVTQAVLEALHKEKIAIPGELSVVGFGDAPGFDWWGPGLTTMRMPAQELATACGDWFLDRLKAKSVRDPLYSAAVPATFVPRKSTAPLTARPPTTPAAKRRATVSPRPRDKPGTARLVRR